MRTASLVLGGVVAAATLATGCLGASDDAAVGPADSMLEPAAKPGGHSPMLNLSHIECTDEGTVLAHFVLLFAGHGTPGDLIGTYNGGAFGPVAPDKHTGNVWHYNVILPAGEIDILSASVTTADGEMVSLHNPSEYAGDYQCSEQPPVCPVVVEPIDLLCVDQPLGNPGAECGYFGLVPEGKDDGLTGTSFIATIDAYVAIVKSGTGGCGAGAQAYRIYVDVTAGDLLETPAWQNISHVTYCACPE